MPLFRDGHCPPLEKWNELGQIAGFTACALFANILIAVIIWPLQFTDATDFLKEVNQVYGLFWGFLAVTIVAPFYETLIGQWFPLMVAKICKRKPLTQIIWASVWFACLHIANGPAHVLQTFGVGWVFASCFLFGWNTHWFKAFRLTFATHGLHNAVVFGLFNLFQTM